MLLKANNKEADPRKGRKIERKNERKKERKRERNTEKTCQ
jgi:hypothetical protein